MSDRVVLIGAGDVGVAYAYALVNQGLVHELSVIDINEQKVRGEVMDLNHGVVWAPSPTRVKAGTYADCADADVVVITAGAAQRPGETRLDLVGRNVQIFRGIVGSVMEAGFSGILLVATNPVDVMAYAAWRFSGLPAERVIGSGTALDSARLRFMLGQLYGVAPGSVHAAIIGEHGDTEVPALSSANIAGAPLSRDLDAVPGRREEIERIFDETRTAAYQIIDAKGSTSYGIGMALARITRALLRDEDAALPVSTLLSGQYGIDDLYIGVPAVLGRSGVKSVVELSLSADESEALKHSAEVLSGIVEDAGLRR
ncbi:L-lactate dehydrogenase [Arthrobacter sp. UM1]|uniref:L-lactate dehydrogenase n=1 Tax=Arthrobacter sp. UM1 TaxID=2766776 RepID=UPI001CF6F631|nr:L-lactate dehydrogenase [Arthrobacter sp. UM1]MCB4208203.1 L-lactate dehydrogenase [Arthrobacter sp. UM1]